MKKMLKKQEGVTLIVLIVAVIVILILSSVVIRFGFYSMDNTNDSKIEANLKIVQQSIIQEYSKSTVNKNNNFYGKKISSINELNNIKNGLNIYLQKNDSPTDYYILQDEDLSKLGIEVPEEQMYLVDYETGEVWDITNKVYSNGSYAYLSGSLKLSNVIIDEFIDDDLEIPNADEIEEDNNKTITWSLSEPKYETKTALRPNGYTDEFGIKWGTGAYIDLTLKCEQGLKSQEYVFLYSWRNNSDSTAPKFDNSVLLFPKEGDTQISTTIYISSFTGKGRIYVKPSEKYIGNNDTVLPEAYRYESVNLDNIPPKITSLLYKDNEYNFWGLYDEELIDQDYLNFRILSFKKDMARVYDDDTGIFRYDPITEKQLNEVNDTLDHSSAVDKTNFFEPNYMNSAYLVSQRMTSYRLHDQIEEHKNYFDISLATFSSDRISSGVYYLWHGSISRRVAGEDIELTDNVGNVIEQPFADGPVYFDMEKPQLSSVKVKNNKGKVIIKDEFSGLNISEDNIKKIKYKWISDPSDNIDYNSLKTVDFNNIKFEIDNEFKNKTMMIIDIDNDSKNNYLYVTIDGFEDMAHNKSNDFLISQ